MMPRLLVFVMCVMAGFSLQAQEEDDWQPPPPDQHFLLKTYPLRYVYGPNGEFTWVLRNKQEITLLYQYHHRDFFSIKASNDMLGFSLIPRLISGGGYTTYLSYMFPVTDHFAIGPKVGYKNVFGMPRDSTNRETRWPDLVHQQNGYVLFNMLLRNQYRGFIIEAYMQMGVVGIKREKYDFHQGQLFLDEDLSPFLLPHILLGVSLGLGW